MSTLAELAWAHTSLGAGELDHLQRLVAGWGLLADLSFADLLLLAPVDSPAPGRLPEAYVVLAQVRPTTSQTLHRSDLVGTVRPAGTQTVAHSAYRSGEVVDGSGFRESVGEQVQVLAVPVRVPAAPSGRVAAVLLRESAPAIGRRHGELEQAYQAIFSRFARMIAIGEYPFPEPLVTVPHMPRAGDGALLLDATARVRYSSPNANSALHRLGVSVDVGNHLLGEVGLDEGVVSQAWQTKIPAVAELVSSANASVLAHCLPLLERGQVVGALLLVRDISDLKRLDRLLVTKDTHIREIHHRVKNNLQTISSLLRIQGRRLVSPEAKHAIAESVRRIASIALVHEALSREANEDVSFTEVARPLLRMIEESLVLPERPVRFRLVGDAAMVPAGIATPLALVLAELLQNAVDHGYGMHRENVSPADASKCAAEGEVILEMLRDDDALDISVTDYGYGLPAGFHPETSVGLGLSIVKTLVENELNGSIDFRVGEPTGTVVHIRIPLST